MLWLTIDAIIRKQSQGKKSLDDFCHIFLGQQSEKNVLPFDLKEVLRLLDEIVPYNWEKFVEENITRPMPSLSLTVLSLCGYSCDYQQEPGEYLKELMKHEQNVIVLDSLGMEFNKQGHVVNIIPEMPGEKAGFAPTMIVLAVNGKKFSRERLEEAIAESPKTKKIEFLVSHDESCYSIVVDYEGGSKYFCLRREPNTPDILANIAEKKCNLV